MNFESFKTLLYRNICAKLKFKWQLENERIFLVATFFLDFFVFWLPKRCWNSEIVHKLAVTIETVNSCGFSVATNQQGTAPGTDTTPNR